MIAATTNQRNKPDLKSGFGGIGKETRQKDGDDFRWLDRVVTVGGELIGDNFTDEIDVSADSSFVVLWR